MARTASLKRTAVRKARRTERTVAANTRRIMQTSERAARTTQQDIARNVSDTSRRVTDTAVQQFEMATEITEPVANALVRAGQEYLICANRMSAASIGFAARRWSRDFAFVLSLGRCKKWSDTVSLQRDWARQALGDYVQNVADMTRLTGLAALESWPQITRTAEAGR
jgi:hypothetical protein